MKQRKVRNENLLHHIIYILKILQKYNWHVMPVFFAMVFINGILPLFLVYLPKYIVSYLTQYQPVGELLRFFVAAGACLITAKLLAVFLNNRYELYIVMARSDCYESMLILKTFSLEYALLEDPNVQDQLTKARQISWSQNSGAEGTLRELGVILGSLTTLVGYVLILIQLNLILPLILSFLVAVNLFIYKKARDYEFSLRNENATLERKMEYLDNTMSLIDCGKDIRLFELGGYLSAKYLSLLRLRNQSLKREKFCYLRMDVFNTVLSAIREGAIYGYLVFSFFNGRFDIGTFLLYFGALIGFSSVLVQIVDSASKIRLYAKCITDFKTVMELPDERRDSPQGFPLPESVSIVFDRVSFHYANSNRMILEELSLSVQPGERLAIVGENGAGKSTLIKILTGLYDPVSGRVFINGDDTTNMTKNQRYKMCAAVFQDIFQYAFTLEENVAFLEHGEIQKELLKQSLELADLMDFVQSQPKGTEVMIRKDFDETGVTLSGGLEQKLALARALYKNAPLLILDEPTAALDPLAERMLYEKLNSLTKGKTAIYISHRLSSTQFCDKIAFLHHGHITEYGTHKELLVKDGDYARMFKAQSLYYCDSASSGTVE